MRAAAILLLLALAPVAAGEVDGDCTVIIAGQDMAEHSSTDPELAIRIDNASANIEYWMQMPPGAAGYEIVLDAGITQRSLLNSSLPGSSEPLNITGNLTLEEYAWVGSGLYIIRAVVTGNGDTVCEAEALVKFQAGRLLTATMIGAGVAVAGGGLGVGATVVESLREAKEKLDAVKDFKQHLQVAAQALQRK